jgi:hypothetical protein
MIPPRLGLEAALAARAGAPSGVIQLLNPEVDRTNRPPLLRRVVPLVLQTPSTSWPMTISLCPCEARSPISTPESRHTGAQLAVHICERTAFPARNLRVIALKCCVFPRLSTDES